VTGSWGTAALTEAGRPVKKMIAKREQGFRLKNERDMETSFRLRAVLLVDMLLAKSRVAGKVSS
jgi:hypothetical protein